MIEAIEKLIGSSYMLGRIHAEEENPEYKINAADETEIPAVPFEEAMNFLKSKVPMTKAEWLELEPKLRFRAFTVAQLGSAEVVDKAKQILLKSFEKGGGTYSDTWEELKKKVNVNALGIKPGYWENVFRTNTQSAYIAGKLQQYENTGVAAYQLLVIEDSRTSKICRHLLTASGYGMIISVDHPFWKKYGFPPYHFQCRTSIRAIWPSQVGKFGNMVENPTMKSLSKFKVQEGFGGNPLDRGSWWEMTDNMKRLAEKFEVMEKIEAKEILFSGGKYGKGDGEKIVENGIINIKAEPVIDEIAGIKKGNPMTFDEADSGSVNPGFYSDSLRQVNCQSCVPTFIARLMGFNVQVKPYEKTNQIMEALVNKTNLAFIDRKTKTFPIIKTPKKTGSELADWLLIHMEDSKYYSIGFEYKSNLFIPGGHVLVIYKNKGTLTLYDPQDYTKITHIKQISSFLRQASPNSVEVYKISDCDLNKIVLDSIVEASL